MKYLYPYECEKKGLSSPSELQSAIDGNRREGRRPSYHSPHMHPRGPSLAYHHGLDLHTPSGSPPPTMIPHPSRIPTLPPRLSPSTSPSKKDPYLSLFILFRATFLLSYLCFLLFSPYLSYPF